MTPRAISYATYEMFRKRYKIKKHKYVKTKLDDKPIKIEKSIDDIRKEIYQFEQKNQDKIENGLYFNVKT